MKERQASVIDVDRVVNVCSRRCESSGVSIHWNRDGIAATMEDGKITLPAIEQPITQKQLHRLYGMVVHECGHHARKEAFKILKAARPVEAVAATYNMIEDDGMERDIASRYPGDAKALGVGNSLGMEEVFKSYLNIKEKISKESLTTEQAAPFVIQYLAQLSRAEWDHEGQEIRSKLFSDIHPDMARYVEEMVKEGWVDRMRATRTPHDTWDVALDIFKRLYPEVDQKEIEDLRQSGHSMEPGEDPATDTGENSLRLDKEAVKGDGIEAQKGEQTGDEAVVNWKDVVITHHAEWKPRDPKYVDKSPEISEVGIGKGVHLMPMSMINVIDLSTPVARKKQAKKYGNYERLYKDYMANNLHSRTFANNIRRYIQAQNRTMIDREKKHGRIDKRSIVKLALPPIDGGEYNKKIFYRWRDKRELNTCIHVLTDWSGSMSGRKMHYAADASGRLVHVFDRILKVPVMLSSFTTGESPCDIALIKPFNKKMSPEDVARGFAQFRPFSSGNNDADAVMWAYNQIRYRDEQRKILIVLSDGCPTDAWDWGCADSNLKHVTKGIQEEGVVELYGVGICDSSVKRYYKNNKVLKNQDQINDTLFRIIKEGVK